MNNVSLSGNVCRPPELKTTQSGKQVLNLSIAINEGKDKTEFVNLVAWEKAAELINQYVGKGDLFTCTGRLQTRSWEDQQGNKRYATEVVISQFDFPPKKAQSSKPGQENSMADNLEDEIPF